MILDRLLRVRPAAVAASVLLFAGCNSDQMVNSAADPIPQLASAGAAAPCTPGAEGALDSQGKPFDSERARLCAAQAGDLITIALRDVHPTQPSLGYDEVYYKLGRYALGKDKFNKRFGDWCEANGQVDVAFADANSTLHDPSTFHCTLAVGSETQASIDVMKTVVIGPRGELYLTDGHHTFTSFWETADGGPDVKVRVRVEGNLSRLGMAAFWSAINSKNGMGFLSENRFR